MSVNMSEEPLSKKKLFCPWRRSRFNKNNQNSYQNEPFNESICNNIGVRRLRCPWGRRQSFITREKNAHLLESSINVIRSIDKSSDSKYPLKKENDSRNGPWGRKFAAVSCLSTGLKQAKVVPSSTKLCCSSDSSQTRRTHLINKFDDFTKDLLKITGKLSQETVAMITAKIKENLEKPPEYSVRSMDSSSFRTVRNNYINTIENNRNDVKYNKLKCESFCLPLVFKPTGLKKNNKNYPVDTNDSAEKDESVVDKSTSIDDNVDVSDDSLRDDENEKDSTNEKDYLVAEKYQCEEYYSPAPSTINLNVSSKTSRNAVADKWIFSKKRGSFCAWAKEKVTNSLNLNKYALISDKFKPTDDLSTSLSTSSVLDEPITSSDGKSTLSFKSGNNTDEESLLSHGDTTFNFGHRPESVDRTGNSFETSNMFDDGSLTDDKSLTSDAERPSITHGMSKQDVTITSAENKPRLKESLSVSFGRNTAFYDKKIYSIGGKCLSLKDHKSNKDGKTSTNECNRRKRKQFSKLNPAIPPINNVKCLNSFANKEIPFKQSKNSLQCFKSKKTNVQSTSDNRSNGYNVQLVRFSNGCKEKIEN